MRYSFVADHFQYHASIAIFVLIASALTKLARRVNARHVAHVLAFLLLSTLGYLTWQQTGIYKDAWTLWNDTAKKDPGSWMVWANLGNILAQQQKFEEAYPYYQRAYDLAPSIDDNLCNIGTVYARTGKLDEAEAAFNESIRRNPMYATAYGDMGDLYLYMRDDPDTAIEYYRKGLSLEPTSAKAHFNIGAGLEHQANNLKERAAKTKNPADAQQWLQKLTAAIQEYEIAADMKPDLRDAHYDAAVCLMQIQQYDRAIAHLNAAIQADPNHAESWTNLGNAYFQTAQFREAAAAFERALRINPNLEPARKGLMAARARG